MTFRKSPKNILALALLLIGSFAFSDSEYFYNDLEDGVEIAGCKGDCSLLPEKVDGKNIKGISDSAFNINVFTGLGWSLTWNYRFNSETDSSYTDESAWFNDTENSSDLPILILGQSPDGQGSDFEDRAVPPVNSSNLHNLSSIKIPQGYQYIGDYFFSSNSLENISLNEGLQTIGMQAFSSNGIRDIVIPDSVIEISSKAFAINPLSHVIFLGNRPNIGDEAFETQYQQLSKELICLLEVRETDKDFNDCYPDMNSANTYFTNCLTAKEASDMLASMTESDLFSMDYGCSSNTYADYEIPHVDLDARIKMTILRIAPEIGFNFNFSSISSPESILSASLCPDESDCDALFGVLCPDELDCDVNDFFAAGFDIDDYINLLSENFDAPFHELDIEDLMSVFESGSFTTHDSVYSIPTAINFIEFSTKVIPEGYSSLIEYKLPPSIYFCSGKIGWPGEPINGVTPKERDCDSMVWDIDQNNSVDALTDGLLLMRYAFGLRGDSLTENVISSDSLIDKAAVQQNIEQIMHLVDINEDGNFDALTDALILLRYLFGVSGNGLVDEEMLTSNKPSAGSIKAYIESHMIKALSN